MFHLRGLKKLLIVQARLFLREPMALFFALLFAPMMLVLMGFIFGNAPDPLLAGRGHLDTYLPTYAALIIGIVGFVAAAIETTNRRESGVLRRFRATPLRPATYIVGDVVVYFAMTMLGVLFLFLLGTVVYRVRFVGNPLALLAGVCLSTGAFLSLGYVLAGLAPSVRVATLVGNLLLYPMVIFSGATVPLEVMPEAAQKISRFVPLSYVATLLRGLWFGEPFRDHWVSVAVLFGILVVGTTIAAWTFRWE